MDHFNDHPKDYANYIEFSNGALRKHFPVWLRTHEHHLKLIEDNLFSWHKISLTDELKRAKTIRPMAIVFDIDEVLLCAIRDNFHITDVDNFHVADYFSDPRVKGDKQSWPRRDGLCPAYPGASSLLAKCASLGLEVFYVTGRQEALRETTITNFKVTGLPIQNSQLIMRPASDHFPTTHDWKENVRKLISADYRIIANVGDQVSDMGDHGDIHYLIPHHYYKVTG